MYRLLGLQLSSLYRNVHWEVRVIFALWVLSVNFPPTREVMQLCALSKSPRSAHSGVWMVPFCAPVLCCRFCFSTSRLLLGFKTNSKPGSLCETGHSGRLHQTLQLPSGFTLPPFSVSVSFPPWFCPLFWLFHAFFSSLNCLAPS